MKGCAGYRLTENVTDTKISYLDIDHTIHSITPAEDVGRLQVVVADGRMLAVEE